MNMDLGAFDQPLLLFGGPYSNLQALLALKEQAEKFSIPAENIICTGDIVAYCGQPFETVETIREWGIHVLMGNCEESFADNADDCGCGFEEGSSCDLLSVEWFRFANQKLNTDQRKWFGSLPRSLTFTINKKRCQVVHGSATSINQFVFASNADQIFKQQFNSSDADIIIAGHSGIPFTKAVENKLWHNAGAIGMPANDGSNQTWFSLLIPEQDTLQFKIIPLNYNYDLAAQKMIENGLDNGYAKALTTGLWPSNDILPKYEKDQQGKTLYSTNAVFPV
jgi:predicted phosphodiesterase